MEFCGYIEGYYGKLLNWDERTQIVAKLSQLSMNCYLYGPKEDSYHRKNWSLAYPSGWMENFSKFARNSKKLGVEVIPSLAPGLSYKYQSASDFNKLCQKISAFQKIGIKKLAILMDDISDELPSNLKPRYSSLGGAHGALLEKLQQMFKTKISFWFCPTIYTSAFSNRPVEQNLYLKDLARTLPKNIPIFWTGDQVISLAIQKKNLKPLHKLFPQQLLIWDNYYANDYCPRRIFLGPFRKRNSDVLPLTKGYFINPTGNLYTDIMYLEILSVFFKKKAMLTGYKEVIKKRGINKIYLPLLKYFDSPFATLDFFKIPLSQIKKDIQLCTQYLFEEKGPLHCEWYPYMQGLRADLNLRVKRNEPDFLKGMPSRQPDLLRSILSSKGFSA